MQREAAEKGARERLLRVFLLVITSIALTTLIRAITVQKLLFLYREELHLGASDVTTLLIVLGIPAYLQPLMGGWADVVPLFGSHRRSYFVAAALLKGSGFACLAFLGHYAYGAVIGTVLIINGGTVLLSVMVNAVMVAVGNVTGATGRLLSVLRFIPYAMNLSFASHLGGHVLEYWSYQQAFLAAATLGILAIPLALLIPEERPHAATVSPEVRRRERDETADRLRKYARSPGIWAIAGYVFYLLVTPGMNTAQVYYETDVPHFSKQLVGDLNMWAAGGAIAGILLFGAASRRLPVVALVWTAWIMDLVSYPVQATIHSPLSGCLMMAGEGAIGAIYLLCLQTLAARACPRGLEAAVYGLVLSALALGETVADKFGSTLYDLLGPANHFSIQHGWYWGLTVGFGFTVLGAAFIPFLPTWTRSRQPLSAPWQPEAA